MEEKYDIDPSYKSLMDVLFKAYHQASRGKGKERHSYFEDEPFDKQLIIEIANRLGGDPTGPLYQAVKKIYESVRLDKDAAKKELYGAINYIAAAIILIDRKPEK